MKRPSKIHHRHKHQEGDGGIDDWLMTYADMITLMFAFFVILFGLSEPKSENLHKMQKALEAGGFAKDTKEQHEEPYENLAEELELMVEGQQLDEMVSVQKSNRGIDLELSSSNFYEPGSSRFKKEALPILTDAADALRKFEYDDYTIEVEGHTDDTQAESAQYPSNWELSAARAANVVRFFISKGLDPARLKASGFGDARPKVKNMDAQGNPIPENRELNRRVVIRILRAD